MMNPRQWATRIRRDGGGATATSVSSIPAGLMNSSTTFVAIPASGFTFTAPPSGKTIAEVDAVISIAVGNGFGYVSFEVKTGAVIGSGTQVYAPADNHAAEFRASTAGMFAKSHAHRLLTLTPGAVYNIQAMHRSNAVDSTQTFAVTLSAIPTN